MAPSTANDGTASTSAAASSGTVQRRVLLHSRRKNASASREPASKRSSNASPASASFPTLPEVCSAAARCSAAFVPMLFAIVSVQDRACFSNRVTISSPALRRSDSMIISFRTGSKAAVHRS